MSRRKEYSYTFNKLTKRYKVSRVLKAELYYESRSGDRVPHWKHKPQKGREIYIVGMYKMHASRKTDKILNDSFVTLGWKEPNQLETFLESQVQKLEKSGFTVEG